MTSRFNLARVSAVQHGASQIRAGLVLWGLAATRYPLLVPALVVVAIFGTALAVARNLLADGFPPGVDTPTFLHMSWFARETLRGAGGWIDPYWYGGFPIFIAYPPLSYAVVGGVAAAPGMGLVFAYKVALLSAYAATGLATYYLARQLGSGRAWSLLAAMLVLLAYPVQVTVGLWGWFSSIVALPLALSAFALLEKAYQGGQGRFAVLGGVALGLSALAHHMTAFAFALWLPGWAIFWYVRQPELRPYLYKVIWLFVLATAATTVWWVIFWAVHLVGVGFQREVPGLWSFPLSQYLVAINQRDLMGFYAYPTYLGIGLILMAVGGALQGFLAPSRATPCAILLVIMVFFSLGEQANPLVRLRPLDGLDVARFQLYLVPVAAVAGLPFLDSAGRALAELLPLRARRAWLPGAATGILVALIVVQGVWDGATASGKLFWPYRVAPELQQALDWLGGEGRQGKVLGVGVWHWDDFLVPYLLRQPVVDGWHDEGAENWRPVRALRMMMWSKEVDVPGAHRLMGELGGRYILVQDYFEGESPAQFREGLGKYPELFSPVADWGKVTIFERLSSP